MFSLGKVGKLFGESIRIFILIVLGSAGIWINIASSAFATTPAEVAKLVASDGASGDHFGQSVGISGHTTLIGVPEDDDAGRSSGAAFVYVQSGGTWTEQAKLTASDAVSDDKFGNSVSIDEDTAVVGAYREGSGSGSAYVFTRTGTVWTEQAKLIASDRSLGDNFGISVSVDGDTVVVGAWKASPGGAAYVFTRSGDTWSEQAKLIASDGALVDQFGISVSVNLDSVLVGAWQDIGNAGSAYVFRRYDSSWIEEAKLFASDAESGDVFGSSVSIDADSSLIGAYGDDDAGSLSGSAYLFERTGTSWVEQAKLTASDAESGDNFGSSVDINGDLVLIGADFDDDNGIWSGSAYVFVRSGMAWNEVSKLTASDAQQDDRFGNSVSLEHDRAIVGAWEEDGVGTDIDVGSAYVFELNQDADADGLLNLNDNCSSVPNPEQQNFDGDAFGDRCEFWIEPLSLGGPATRSSSGNKVSMFKWVPGVAAYEGLVKDPLTAVAGGPISFLPSGRQPVDTGIADISGSSALAVLGVDGNGRAWVEVKDAASGNLIQDVWYSPSYTPISLAVVPDLNNNGASELAVLLTRDSDGRGWVHIKDGATGDLIRYIWLRTGYTPVDLEILPDLDGNPGDEVAVLMTRDSDGRAWVEVKDAKTGNLVKYVWFRKDHTPLDLEIVPDQDGNPGAELAVLMSRDSDNRTWVEVKDTLTNALVRYVWFKKDHTPVDLEIVPNFNGNPGSELAVLMTRDSDNRTWVQTKDSANGDVVSYIWFQPDFSPRDLEVMDNLDGNPANDLAVLGEKGDGRVQVEFKDPQTGAFINRLGFN